MVNIKETKKRYISFRANQNIVLHYCDNQIILSFVPEEFRGIKHANIRCITSIKESEPNMTSGADRDATI